MSSAGAVLLRIIKSSGLFQQENCRLGGRHTYSNGLTGITFTQGRTCVFLKMRNYYTQACLLHVQIEICRKTDYSTGWGSLSFFSAPARGCGSATLR